MICCVNHLNKQIQVHVCNETQCLKSMASCLSPSPGNTMVPLQQWEKMPLKLVLAKHFFSLMGSLICFQGCKDAKNVLHQIKKSEGASGAD